jgi:hypothetical protein
MSIFQMRKLRPRKEKKKSLLVSLARTQRRRLGPSFYSVLLMLLLHIGPLITHLIQHALPHSPVSSFWVLGLQVWTTTISLTSLIFFFSEPTSLNGVHMLAVSFPTHGTSSLNTGTQFVLVTAVSKTVPVNLFKIHCMYIWNNHNKPPHIINV